MTRKWSTYGVRFSADLKLGDKLSEIGYSGMQSLRPTTVGLVFNLEIIYSSVPVLNWPFKDIEWIPLNEKQLAMGPVVRPNGHGIRRSLQVWPPHKLRSMYIADGSKKEQQNHSVNSWLSKAKCALMVQLLDDNWNARYHPISLWVTRVP